jgi:hypothetical protein
MSRSLDDPAAQNMHRKTKKTFHYVHFVKSISPGIADTEDSLLARDVRFSLARRGAFTYERYNRNTRDGIGSGR